MTFQLGSISSGTLLTEDLLDAFATELDYQISHGRAEDASQADEWRKLISEAQEVDPESEEAGWILEELDEALNDCAPSYVYFGAHEGDGADFGFWPAIYSLENDARYGEVLKVADSAEIPADYRGPVMLVSDHGNVTFGYVDASGEFVEEWSCV